MAKSIGEVARTAAVALVGAGLCAGGAGLWRLGDAVARHAEGGAVWEMRDATTGGGDLGRDRDGRESIAASVVRTRLNGTVAAGGAGAAVASTALAGAAPAAQAEEPTIVWYGNYGGMYGNFVGGALLRAWSDGTVEMKKIAYFGTTTGDACSASVPCSSPWLVISSPTTGYRAHADLDADQQVGGADLAILLSSWGDAPRVAVPASVCPLDLVVP